MTRTRQVLFRVATPVLSLAVLFAVFEAGLRLCGYDPLGRVLDGRAYFLRASAYPGLDYEPVPGVRGYNWGTRIEINSHGFRDREYSIAKPPGVARVVVIGDSITFGSHLPVERTFPKRLEAMYGNAGRTVEVLNLAVAGYDTLNEVAFLEENGLAFRPDVVVVGYCINDLGTHSIDLILIKILDRYGFLTRHSRFLQFLTGRMDQVKQLVADEFTVGETEEVFRAANAGRIAVVRDDPEVQRLAAGLLRYGISTRATLRYPFLPWYLSEARLGKLRFSFERLADLARENDFRVVVLLIPFLDDEGHADAYRFAYDLVRHEAERVGFRTTDPTEAFRARGFESLMLTRDKMLDVVHPNEKGHEILAEQLYAVLDDVLPPRPAGAVPSR